ncbi:bifunctional heptose 7-phosphate kinase/heptose 1-phosphate adenyltransferase [Agromyces indicus]|uniref:PfkB family carbohydrate kinase n=1 Tax=Agromyces indicus TaxID=758919 RepID=A0ABU1FL97_9MICO|nr:PfkB family carbohydrate kinase [Agromyces indicus]MDR5692137.1 PfkB family carbohydrate kinase [Agromyces indicus]
MSARIVVVGDTLLDVDLNGTAQRLSPDGPVPVVDVSGRLERAGGAGLVATFLALEGTEVTLATALARDAGAGRVRAALTGVILAEAALPGPTPTKTRIRASGQPVARIDEGCGPPEPVGGTGRIVEAIRAADVVIAADYGRGLLADGAVRAALEECALSVAVVWDPHPRGVEPVPGCRVVTPNRSEAAARTDRPIDDLEAALDVAERLRRHWDAESVAVTLDSDGAAVALRDRPRRVIPADAVDVADACGAGDRLVASVGLELVRGADVADALARGVAHATAYLAAGGVASLPTSPPERPSRTRPLAAVG